MHAILIIYSKSSRRAPNSIYYFRFSSTSRNTYSFSIKHCYQIINISTISDKLYIQLIPSYYDSIFSCSSIFSYSFICTFLSVILFSLQRNIAIWWLTFLSVIKTKSISCLSWRCLLKLENPLRIVNIWCGSSSNLSF